MKSLDRSHLIHQKKINKRGILQTVLINPDKDKHPLSSIVSSILALLKSMKPGDEKVGKNVTVKREREGFTLHSTDGHSLHQGVFSVLEAANHIASLSSDESYRDRAVSHAKARSANKVTLRDRIRNIVNRLDKVDKPTPEMIKEGLEISSELASVGADKAARNVHKAATARIEGGSSLMPALMQAMSHEETIKAVHSGDVSSRLAALVGTSAPVLASAFPKIDFASHETPADAALAVLDSLKEKYDRRSSKSSSAKVSSERKSSVSGSGKKFPYSKAELSALVGRLVSVAGLTGDHASEYTSMFEEKPKKAASSVPNRVDVLSGDLLESVKSTPVDVPVENMTAVDAGERFRFRGFEIERNGRYVDVNNPDGSSIRMPGSLPGSITMAFKYVKHSLITNKPKTEEQKQKDKERREKAKKEVEKVAPKAPQDVKEALANLKAKKNVKFAQSGKAPEPEKGSGEEEKKEPSNNKLEFKSGQKIKIKGQGNVTYKEFSDGKHKFTNSKGLPVSVSVSDAWMRRNVKGEKK